MVWQYCDTPDKYTWIMGNAQRLPSGHTFLCFVQAHYPAVIEVDTNGVKQFEMSLVPNVDHYRAFRFPWNGVVAVPYLILEPDSTGLNLIFNIANGGTTVPSIQLRQAGKPLMQGKKYVFEFDAWSQGPRYIEAKVGQTVAPQVNYSGIGFSFITPTRTHFRYVFTMQETSDFNSSVMFNLGSSALDVCVDNISLFNAPPGDFNLDRRVDLQDLAVMTDEWLKQLPNLNSDPDDVTLLCNGHALLMGREVRPMDRS